MLSYFSLCLGALQQRCCSKGACIAASRSDLESVPIKWTSSAPVNHVWDMLHGSDKFPICRYTQEHVSEAGFEGGQTSNFLHAAPDFPAPGHGCAFHGQPVNSRCSCCF